MTLKTPAILAKLTLTIISLVCIFGVNFTTTYAQNYSLSRLQQQINIINGEFSTTTGTDSPTDNSLGIINYTASNYTSPITYFEVVARCASCSGGNAQVSVSLYNSSGVLQTTLTTDSTDYIRLRSNSLILPDGDYTIRFHRDATSGTANVKAARLIINQTASPLTTTQTQIEVGHYENRTDTSAIALYAPKYYQYNHNAYSGDVTAYFEATFSTSNNFLATTYAYNSYDTGNLEWSTNPSNMTDGSTANYASTSTDSQTQRLTGNTATNADNGVISTVELRVFGYQTDGADGQVTLQPRFSGTTNGDTHDYVLPQDSGNAAWSNYFDITTDTNAPSTWTWDEIDNLDVDVIFGKGADINNTAFVSHIQLRVTHTDTEVLSYVELYNRTNSTVVATLSTSNNTPTRVRSDALTTNWDTTNADEYEVRVYTTTFDNPVYISNAKIIIDQTQAEGLKEVELVHHYLTTLRQQTNTIYTQETFINQFDPSRFANTNVVRAFFETTMYTDEGGSSYAALYDTDNSVVIDSPVDSEILLSDTQTFTRSRTGNLGRNTDWPTAAAELTTVLKTSLGDTATISNSVLIIQTAVMDPELTFAISGVESAQTNNGVTTTEATTITTLPFGNVAVASPKFAAHQLQVTTNEAATGYVVYISLAYPMQGYYPANNVDPFAGSGALWTSPQLWTTPTGTTPNQDTAWIGANTSDTRVSGWSSGFARFGPIDTTPVEVMRSNFGNTDDTHVVTYGFEVNILQPADTYASTLIYNILPTF